MSTIEERAKKYIGEQKEVWFEWDSDHLVNFVKQEIERERDRILYQFEEDHQIEYELDVSPLNIREFFTGNEWVTLQLIVRGKRG